MITHSPFCFRRALKQVIWGVTTATDLGNILDMLARILCERALHLPNQLDFHFLVQASAFRRKEALAVFLLLCVIINLLKMNVERSGKDIRPVAKVG